MGLWLEILGRLAAADDRDVPHGVLTRIEDGADALVESRAVSLVTDGAVCGDLLGLPSPPRLNDGGKRLARYAQRIDDHIVDPQVLQTLVVHDAPGATSDARIGVSAARERDDAFMP